MIRYTILDRSYVRRCPSLTFFIFSPHARYQIRSATLRRREGGNEWVGVAYYTSNLTHPLGAYSFLYQSDIKKKTINVTGSLRRNAKFMAQPLLPRVTRGIPEPFLTSFFSLVRYPEHSRPQRNDRLGKDKKKTSGFP